MEDVVKKAMQGDMQAFEQLVLEHEKMIYNLAFRLLGDKEDAYDASQEAFLKAYKNLSGYKETASFKTWIYTICYNTCIDMLRKKQGKTTASLDELTDDKEEGGAKQFADNSPTPEEALLKKEEAARIEKAVMGLSEEYKTVIVLREMNGLKYDEISKVTGVEVGTVKSRLNRARAKLKEILGMEQN